MGAVTCIRPSCTRPSDRGVHCRKCHQRFKVAQHNNRRAVLLADPRQRGDSVAWPAYGADDCMAYVDQMAAAFTVT